MLERMSFEIWHFVHVLKFWLIFQVYEWMVEQGDRFTIRSSDLAIQLDLIGKVQGHITAEQHFSSLSDSFKDKRTYCSLLNVYTQYKLKEKAQAIFDLMRANGYVTDALSYNVMMTLYLNIHDYANVMNLIQEMRERKIKLDVYSYNIWIVNAASMQDLDQMDSVLQVMQSDNVNVNWSIYTTLANMYIRFDLLDRAEVCLREAEERITGRDRKAFLFFISIYGNIGKKEDMLRIWNWYKCSFNSPLNSGYKTIMQALLKLDDVAGAESLYEEWITSGCSLDPRICQLLMGWYCHNGLSDKARETSDRFEQQGGKPNSYIWVTLAQGFLKEERLEEAVSYFDKALSCSAYVSWRPNINFVGDLLEVCKQREQSECLDQVVAILKKRGLDEIEPYQGLLQQFRLVGSD
jgi:pentatricopeptide repeat protein